MIIPGHQIKNTSLITTDPTGISSRIQKLVKELARVEEKLQQKL